MSTAPGSWVLGVDALLNEVVEEPLDPDALPEAVVNLAIPAVGFVEVEVLAADRTPFSGRASVTLGIVREGEPQRSTPSADIQRPVIFKSTEGGRARFSMVEVGCELEVKVRRGQARVVTRAYGAGPVHSDDTARFEVRLGSDHPVVLLRAVDDQAKPMAEAELEVRVEMSAWSPVAPPTLSITTDSEGYFRIDLAETWTEELSRSLRVVLGSFEAPEANGEVDVSRGLPSGLSDLGEVVLARAPLFVAGRVISETGQPIPAAELVLSTRSQEVPHWQPSIEFRHQTDQEGGFEVRERPAGDEFRLGVSKRGWAAPVREFSPGESNLVIEVSGEGAIAGSVLLDPEIPTDLIYVAVTASSGGISNLRHEDRRTPLDERGSFHLGRLLPDTYTVSLRVRNMGDALISLSDVMVRSGERSNDARLAPIDLRGVVHLHRITLLPPDGAGALRGNISFGPAGANEFDGDIGVVDRETVLITTEEVIDLEIKVSAFRTERLASLRGDAEVLLRRGPTVRMVLVSGIELPEPPFFIKAVLGPVEGHRRVLDFGAVLDYGAPAFDETREIVVRAPDSGRMKVTWIVERRVEGSSVVGAVNLEREQIVEVLEGAEQQRVEVRLSEEELKTIIEHLP